MSQEGLVELERRHALLEKELREHRHRSGWNDLDLAGLKRKKLQIKHEIARLRRTQSSVG